MSTLLRLLALSARGRLWRWARLMRRPKYALGTLLGVGYVGLLFSRRAGGDTWRRMLFQNWTERPVVDLDLIAQIAALALAIALTAIWLLPWGRTGLAFKEAELQLLLPAPIPRSRLMFYAVLRAQRGVVLSALLVSLLMGSGRWPGQLRAFLALWLFISFMDLNGKARALFLLRQREVSRAAAVRRRLALVLPFALLWTVLFPGLYLLFAFLRAGLAASELDLDGLVAAVGAALGSAPARWVLVPFGWPIGPVLEGDWAGFGGAAVAPVLLVAGLLLVIVRSPARFEEVSMRLAREQAHRTARRRRYDRASQRARARNSFPLAPVGSPELAILWKNLMQISRWRVVTVSLLALLLVVWLAVLPAVAGAPTWVFVTLAVMGVIAALMGPLLFGLASRNDLRTDLLQLDAVRTWPVGPTRLMLAEILSPALLGTALWVLGAAIYLAAMCGVGLAGLLQDRPVRVWPLEERILDLPALPGLALVLLAMLPLVAGMTLLMSALKNLAVLAFPAWIELGPTAARGMAALGQRLVTGGAMAIALMLALIPTFAVAAAAGAVHGLTGIALQAWSLVLWSLVAAAPLFAEGIGLIVFAGRMWSRLDPSREILQLGA